METELRKLKKLWSLQVRSSASARESVDIDEERSYTSLKDIMLNSSPACNSSINEQGSYDFDSSNITIKNQLVKRAASAYVQSAAVLAPRNQNYLANVWGKLKIRAEVSSSCWNVYVRNPLRACFQPIYRFFASTVGVLWNRVTHVS